MLKITSNNKVVLLIFIAILAIISILVTANSSKKEVAIRPAVVVSFYPYQFLTSRILGEKGSVYNLTPAGSEPHDYDLTTKDRVRIEKSEILILNGLGLEPWSKNISEVLPAERVLVAGEKVAFGDDPHVWLDPSLMIALTNLITEQIVKIDPAGADTYRQNAAILIADLYSLDQSFRTGLANCEKKEIITGHEAFSYLARRYGFEQNSIAGISPEAEPSANDLASLVKLTKEKNINVIFFETMSGPKFAETIAREIQGKTMVLNPLEGLSEAELALGKDYISEMKQNLENLKIAMVCR